MSFNSEDGGSGLLRNVDKYIPDYTASHLQETETIGPTAVRNLNLRK
jgi:hypothetical protein